MKDLLGNLLVQQVTDTTDVEAVTCDNIGFRKNLLDKPKKEGYVSLPYINYDRKIFLQHLA